VADHRLRTVLAVARRLVADGVRPDPVLVLERARDDGDVTTAAGLGELSMCLLTLVDNVPVPASWPHYAQGTLIAALRRRIAEAGARLTQAAETESLDSLIALVDRETTAVRELAARREPTPTPLRAVP
jgi:replicative DNA helicase